MRKEGSSFSIIPKVKPKTPFWINFLLYLAVFLLVAVVGFFFFFNYKVSGLEQAESVLQDKLAQYQSREFKDFQQEQIKQADKIKQFSQLLADYQYASKLFWFLKRRCHKQAQITSFTFSALNSSLTLQMATRDFLSLGEQLLIFLSSDSVENLTLNEVALNEEGQVEFGLTLSLKKALFSQ